MSTATVTYDPRPLADAVSALAGQCDGARTRDDAGFNGTDAAFGRSLARVPAEAWGTEATAEAYAILRKYKKQLHNLGVDYEAIDAPPAEAGRGRDALRAVDLADGRFVIRFRYDPELVSAVKAVPGRSFDGASKCWTAPLSSAGALATWAERHKFLLTTSAAEVVAGAGPAVVPPTGTVELAGSFLVIRFDYDPKLVDSVRAIPGRSWDGGAKVWRVPTTSIRSVRAFAEANRLATTPEVDALPDVEVPGGTGLNVRLAGGKFVLSFPYDRDLIDRVRELPEAEWSRDLWGWCVPIEAALEVVTLVEQTTAVIEVSAVAALDQARAALAQVEASAAADADLEVPAVVGTGRSPSVALYPFQRAGVRYATAMAAGRCLIADEPGLGKTSQALVSAEMLDAFPLLVVPPASLKLNWLAELAMWLPHRRVAVVPSSGSKQADLYRMSRGGVGIIRGPGDLAARDLFGNRFDVVVVNYDSLGRYHDAIKGYGFAGLVADEVHYCKEGKAQRTKHLIEISESLAPTAARLLLTGTPVLNKGAELVTQIQIMGRLEEFGGAKKVKAAIKRDAIGFNRRLRATCFVRRKKIDVLTELPPKRYVTVAVEGDPDTMAEYRQAEANIVEYLAERARAAALEAGADDEEAREAAWKAAIKAEAAQHLVAIGALKKLAVKAKASAVDEWIANFLDTGKKLIIFGEHREIVSDLATRYAGGRKIQGGMDDSLKQRYKEEFQNTEDARVIVCNLKAGGVGHTLTAASDVMFVEHGWTPSDQDQPTDRAHRIGQRDSVTGWFMVTAGTIDEDILELIDRKRVVCDATTDGDYATLLDDPESRQEVERLIATGIDPAEAGRQVAEDVRKRSVLGDLLVRLTEKGMSQ